MQLYFFRYNLLLYYIFTDWRVSFKSSYCCWQSNAMWSQMSNNFQLKNSLDTNRWTHIKSPKATMERRKEAELIYSQSKWGPFEALAMVLTLNGSLLLANFALIDFFSGRDEGTGQRSFNWATPPLLGGLPNGFFRARHALTGPTVIVLRQIEN